MNEQTEQPDFSTFMLDDFDNPAFCETYLAHHKAEMCGDENDKMPIYSLYWPHGFMAATPVDWGKEYANLWGCVFIYLWKYKGVKLPDTDDLAFAYVFRIYQNNKKDKT
jgi:hypothetical protein